MAPPLYVLGFLLAQERLTEPLRIEQADRSTIEEAIRTTSTAKLRPPLGESSLLQRLVAQYLAHEGYFGSAMAFAEEVRAEADGLRINGQGPRADFHVKEDVDALNRQRTADPSRSEPLIPRRLMSSAGIRVAILDGDIDKAFKYTYACYPNVLKDNEQIYFRMRCRKFIEMNRRCSELRLMAGRQSIRRAQSSIARTGRSYAARDDEQEEDDDEDVDDDEDDDDDDDDDDGAEEEDDDDDQKKGHDEDANEEENRERHRGSVFDEEMEVDEQVQEGGADWDGMEMEENGGADDADDAADDADDAADDAAARHFNLLQETLEYGQELRQEFRDDHRREVKKTLEDTFSLLAYEEPMSSVVAHLLEPSGRVPVAEDLNAAILGTLNRGDVPTPLSLLSCVQSGDGHYDGDGVVVLLADLVHLTSAFSLARQVGHVVDRTDLPTGRGAGPRTRRGRRWRGPDQRPQGLHAIGWRRGLRLESGEQRGLSISLALSLSPSTPTLYLFLHPPLPPTNKHTHNHKHQHKRGQQQ